MGREREMWSGTAALRITVGHTNSDNMHKKVRMVHFPLSVLPRVYHVAASTRTWCVRFWVIRPLPAPSGGI